jgi:hypothetical protein
LSFVEDRETADVFSATARKTYEQKCGRRNETEEQESMEEPIGEAFAGAEQLAVIGRQFHVGEICKVSHQELLRRATTHGDPQAWAAFQKSLEETVLTWLHDHPGSNAACRLQSEQYFVVLAFEGLRQATIKGQVTCETLSEILVFLRVDLNRAILETLRDSKRPGAVSSIWSDGEDGAVRNDLWDWLQARLPNRQEQRLAYLLYHCGLEPSEIVPCCPQEWSDIHEVTRLRRVILKRLMNLSNR